MTHTCDRCRRAFDAALAAAVGGRCPMPGCGGALTAFDAAPPAAALGTVDAAALPYPVALVLGRLVNRMARPDYPPQVALPLLKDAVEAAVKFLAAVLLAEYRLGPAASRERDEGLIEKLVRPSLGQWVHGVVRPVAEWVGPDPVTGLFLAFGRGRPATTPLFDRLAAFVSFRNDAIGHGAERPDHVCRRDLAEWLPFVGDLLRGVTSALADRPLLLVTDTDRAQPWVGPGPAAATVPGSFTRSLVGRFVLGPAAHLLPLDPFVCYVPDPDRTNRLHFYDSLAAYRAQKKRATVLEYDDGMRHDREEPVAGLEAAFTTELLEKAFGRHRGRMAVIEGRVANFGSLVETHADIVGRVFVIDAVKRFVAENDRGLLVIEGEPGKGKTALVAHLLEGVYGDHAPRPARFFYRRTAGITDPDVFVKSVYHELLTTHGVTEAAASAAQQAPDEVATKLATLLADEIAPRLAPHRPQLIFVDALDEADRDAFRALPEALPAGVYVIATTRQSPRKAALARRPGVQWFDLDAPEHAADHLADGREYVDRVAAELPADTRAELARLGGGNFLVLTLLCRHVRDRLAPADVRPFLSRLATAGGAEQLGFIYAEFWGRLTERCPAEFRQSVCDVAGVLVWAKAPLPADAVWGVLGLGSAAWDAALGLLGEYLTGLRESEDGAEETFYQLYHESFADFLRAKLEPDRARLLGQLADYCRGWSERREGFGRMYALRFGPSHQLVAGRADDAVGLLTDWRYLEATAEAGFVPALVTAFREVLAALPAGHGWFRRLDLLSEALRREASFLSRRPQCLFQQLWNLCWWYDHPDAAAHYDLTARAGTRQLPWELEGEKLYQFLEAWRRGKEAVKPGFVWLRSLRPPATNLGTAMRAVYRGHRTMVYSVAWSPDGTELVSGSMDSTVRVWNVETGVERLALRGHTSIVYSVGWSPDGRFLASCSMDGTVRVWDARSGEAVHRISADAGISSNVDWAPDSTRLANTTAGHTTRVWDVRGGNELLTISHPGARALVSSWSPDGLRLGCAFTVAQVVRVFDSATGVVLLEVRVEGLGQLTTLDWAAAGNRIAVGGLSGSVRAFDSETSLTRWTATGLSGWVRHLQWSPDGTRLAVASDNGSIYVLDGLTGQQLDVLRGHDSYVACAAWAPDGRRLATTSMDRSIRLWDTRAGGEWLELVGVKKWQRDEFRSDPGSVKAADLPQDGSDEYVTRWKRAPTAAPPVVIETSRLESAVQFGQSAVAWVSPPLTRPTTGHEGRRVAETVERALRIPNWQPRLYAIEGRVG